MEPPWPPPEVLEVVEDAAAYCGFGIPAEVLRTGKELRWVHSGAAGVGSSLTPEMRESSVTFTNSAGIHGPPMAETVLGMILHFARGLDFAVRSQLRGEWRQEHFLAADSPVREVSGSVVGIVGFGGIGREVARRVVPLGARVLALKRTPAEDPRDGVEVLTGADGFRRVLEGSDYLVLAAPETPETRGMVDAGALARMRPSAVLVNVARGSLMDQEALVEALREGRLRGAALDVFSTEPLPGGHPLWKLPNVLLTPHVSACTRGYWRRETDLIVGNLRRLAQGEELVNVVDREAGY